MIEVREVDPLGIVREVRFQPRQYAGGALHDPAEVERMREAGRRWGCAGGFDASVWDPPDVWEDGGVLRLLCGFHRVALAVACEQASVPVRVHRVSSEAALRLAIRGNLKTRPHDPLEEAAIYRRLLDGGASAAAVSAELDRRDPGYYVRRAALDYLSETLKDDVRRRALRVEYAEAIGEAVRAARLSPGAQAWLRDLARDTRARVEVFRALVAGVIRKATGAVAAPDASAQAWLLDVPPDAMIATAKREMREAAVALGVRDAWRRVEVAGQSILRRLASEQPPEVVAVVDRARVEVTRIHAALGLEGDGAAAEGVRGAVATAVAEADRGVAVAGVVARPILRRWVGNKEWLVPTVLPLLRDRLRPGGLFVEPFGGGASVTAALGPDRGLVGEAAVDVVALYRTVKADPEAVWQAVLAVQAEAAAAVGEPIESRAAYLHVRSSSPSDAVAQAARLLFLAASSFNGLYRVNGRGAFNVPWGARKSLALPTLADLVAFARAFRGVEVRHSDFRALVEEAGKGDVVYLDPPFAGTFDGYVPARWRFDVRAVIVAAVACRDRGASVIVSQPGSGAEAWDGVGTITRLAKTYKVGGRGARRAEGEELLVVLDPAA